MRVDDVKKKIYHQQKNNQQFDAILYLKEKENNINNLNYNFHNVLSKL